jgi:hypothetical protein
VTEKTKKTEFRGKKMVIRLSLAGLAVVLALLIFPVAGSWAGLAISPAYVEASFDKGRPVGEFLISNLGDEEERYRIKAVHFVLTKNGGLDRIPPDEHSLAAWVKFNPTEFTLAPKTKRAVRYVIIPQGNLKAGEYWGAMELESLKTTTASGKDEKGREYNIEVLPTILVPMFGKFGNVRYQGVVKEATLTKGQTDQSLRVLLSNTGDGRLLIEGQYVIMDGAGQEIQKGQLGKFYLLPGMEQIAASRLTSKLASGSYKVRVECRSPQLKESLSNEFDLVWKESQ